MNSSAVERVIETAKKEIGYKEKATNAYLESKTANVGNNNYTKYAQLLDNLNVYNGPKNGFAWCDVFFDYCFIVTFGLNIAIKMLYQPLKGLGASCTYSANYFKNAGRFYKSGPQIGDQIFFSNNNGQSMNHTGLITKIFNGRVYTIEGNTSNASGVVDNGGMVCEKNYAITYNKIAGYGRPNYDYARSEEKHMLITQDEFNKMFNVAMGAYLAELKDNDAGAWSAEDRKWGIEKGLFQGGTLLPNGEPNYMWGYPLTREAAAALFHRYDSKLHNGK